MYHVVPVKYAYHGCVQNEFKDQPIECADPDAAARIDGNDVIDALYNQVSDRCRCRAADAPAEGGTGAPATGRWTDPRPP